MMTDVLAQKLVLMTDTGTGELAISCARGATPHPWLFVNDLSALVADPEVLPDAHELMHDAGMGVIYTRTSAGLVLRKDDKRVAQALFRRFWVPYQEAMADLGDEGISATGRAIMLDLHSYPTVGCHTSGTWRRAAPRFAWVWISITDRRVWLKRRYVPFRWWAKSW
jgi:N-formylglutamate deformylase